MIIKYYNSFENTFVSFLNKCAPMTKEITWASIPIFMSKTIRNLSVAFKSMPIVNNYCSRLYKREQENYFSDLDNNFVKHSKNFW